jgi:hypothetical protein
MAEWVVITFFLIFVFDPKFIGRRMADVVEGFRLRRDALACEPDVGQDRNAGRYCEEESGA